MSSNNSEVYGLAAAAAIRLRKDEPHLEFLARKTRGGLVAFIRNFEAGSRKPEARHITDYLEGLPAHLRDRMAWKLVLRARGYLAKVDRALHEKYAEEASSPGYASLPESVKALHLYLHGRSHDEHHGGPDVLASVHHIVAGLAMLGVRISSNSVPWMWKTLRDRGYLTCTSGVYGEGRANARSNVYHLLDPGFLGRYYIREVPGAGDIPYVVEPGHGLAADTIRLVNRCFEEATDLLRRLNFLERTEGRTITDADLHSVRAPRVLREAA